jgi:hypothetical protein
MNRLDEDAIVDIRLKSPFTAMIAGPTGSGKTTVLLDILAQAKTIATTPPVEIIYCYGAYQEVFSEVKGVRFHDGLVDLDTITNDGNSRWLILDDLMTEISGSRDSKDLFTKFSHHRNISVFFVVQDLFFEGNKTVSRNSHYFFLMKNPRDTLSVSNLARQMPQPTSFIMDAYRQATKRPYSYLFIDVSQSSDDRVRFIESYGSLTHQMASFVS